MNQTTGDAVRAGLAVTYGDYRSHRRPRGWVQAFALAHQLEHDDERHAALLDWWRSADLRDAARSMAWSVRGKPELAGEGVFRCLREKACEARLGGLLVASSEMLDLEAIRIEWGRGLARSVLHLWEEWAEVNVPARLFAPREAIEAIEAGKIMMERKVYARAAIEGASQAEVIADNICRDAGDGWVQESQARLGYARAMSAAAAARAAWAVGWGGPWAIEEVAQAVSETTSNDALSYLEQVWFAGESLRSVELPQTQGLPPSDLDVKVQMQERSRALDKAVDQRATKAMNHKTLKELGDDFSLHILRCLKESP